MGPVALRQAVEQARRGKLVGASLEARVLLWLADEGLREAVSAADAADNGVDPLRYLCITSQARALGMLHLHGTHCNVLLWLADEGMREAASAADAADNGIEPLRYLCITSQARTLGMLHVHCM